MLEQNLVPHGCPVDLIRQRRYRQAVGLLNHLAVSTRPDLALIMRSLSNASFAIRTAQLDMVSHSKLVKLNHSSTATVTPTGQEMWKREGPHPDMPFIRGRRPRFLEI